MPPEEKQRLRAALDQLQAQHQDRLQSCQVLKIHTDVKSAARSPDLLYVLICDIWSFMSLQPIGHQWCMLGVFLWLPDSSSCDYFL